MTRWVLMTTLSSSRASFTPLMSSSVPSSVLLLLLQHALPGSRYFLAPLQAAYLPYLITGHLLLFVPQIPASQHSKIALLISPVWFAAPLPPGCRISLTGMSICSTSPAGNLSATRDSTIFLTHPQSCCVCLRHGSGISPHLCEAAPSQVLQNR